MPLIQKVSTMTDQTQKWFPIDKAPEGEELLMAAKPKGHLRWKYGVGSFVPIYHVLGDWPWTFPPTHFQRIVAPDSESQQ